MDTAQTRKTKNRKNWPALALLANDFILNLWLNSKFKGSACLFQSGLIQVQVGRWCLLVIVELVTEIILRFVKKFTMRLTRLIAVEMVLIHLQRSLHFLLRLFKRLFILHSWMVNFGRTLFVSDKTVLLTFNSSHTIKKRFFQIFRYIKIGRKLQWMFLLILTKSSNQKTFGQKYRLNLWKSTLNRTRYRSLSLYLQKFSKSLLKSKIKSKNYLYIIYKLHYLQDW